jgi:hypothetical protein
VRDPYTLSPFGKCLADYMAETRFVATGAEITLLPILQKDAGCEF